MTKKELTAMVASKSGLSKKDAGQALNAFLAAVKQALVKGDAVQIIGFGTFEVRKRPARSGRNPQTGKKIKIKASKAPAFRAGKALKGAVNK